MPTVLLKLLVLDANCPPLFNYLRQKIFPFVHKLICLGFSIIYTQQIRRLLLIQRHWAKE